MASVMPVKMMLAPVTRMVFRYASCTLSPASQVFLHAAPEVDAVVDADAGAERHHGQRVDLEADADDGHHGVDQDGHQRERQEHQHRA